MSRALLLAAALALAPLPALCENVQNVQGNQSQAGGQMNQGARASEPSQAGQEEMSTSRGNRAELEDLLDRLSQSELRDRLESAVERVRQACAEDIQDVCDSTDMGHGRLVSCVLDNMDELGLRCRLTLARAVRSLQREVRAIADECVSGIRAECANAEKIGDCAEQKSAAISPSCHTLVVAARHIGQKVGMALKDMPVYSSDDKELGRVIEVQRGPDGKVQSVQIQVGRMLGLGDRVVTIGADKLQELRDRIKLQLNADQVRALPETKRQGAG